MKNRVNWNIPVPKALDTVLETAIKEQVYSTKSDLVREAVRNRLIEVGYSF